MLDLLKRGKIVPVVAMDRATDAEPLAEALTAGGLPVAEITLRSDAGIQAISRLSSRKDFLVGAGTVHSVDQAKQVCEAGAKFVVTPGFNPKTVQWCLDHSMPIFPGVSCPTDLESAIEFGLSVVKFFPAEQLGGVAMLKALQGPYGNMQFIPTGGISVANLTSYLSLPAVVACGGSWMVKAELINTGRFDEIEKRTKEAVGLLA